MKNLLEDAVFREYEILKDTIPGFCGCAMCRDDVLVYALNRLAPKYVARREGEVLTNVSMGSDQPKADLSVVLLEALQRVHADPQPGHTDRERTE